jgi:PAS domain S-box-containing protein
MRPERPRPASAAARLLVLVVVAAAYATSGTIGLSLAFVNESTTAVWPPAGIALGALLLCGRWVWPAVTVGAFLVNVTTSENVAAALAIASGNTLEVVAAAWAAQRFAGGRAAFDRTPDLLRFVALSVMGATTIAATVGTGSLLAAGLATRADAASIWLTWWLGDAAGIMMFTPLIVLWAAPGREPWTLARGLEALALAAGVIGTASVVFGDTIPGNQHLQLQFLAIPLLLWAAFRFGARETATCATMLSVFAIEGTLDGQGPFTGSSLNQSLLTLQGFIAVISMVMLAVAAEVAGRWRVEREMRSLNDALEQRVASRTDELTRVHNRLVEAQHVAHIGSWEWDVATNVVWWSEELYRIYGISPAEPVTYESFLTLVHHDDRSIIAAAIDAASRHGEPFAFEHRIVRPDGDVRVVHGQGRVLLDAAGRTTRMVGTSHDITERVALEEERAQRRIAEAARQDAEAASRAKDQFLAMLSHELRTPLNVALGWTHVVRDAAGLDVRVKRAVDTIHRNLQTLTRLVSDIMDVSRIAAGSLALDIRDVDVRQLVEAAVDSVRHAAANRAITIHPEVAPSIPPLKGDVGRLEQVVWNLLANAAKFARDGGRITISVTGDADAVQIVVEDDGPGIAAAFLPHVFEPFRQADSSATREHGGLGLGLSIARQLVQLHGGSITAGNRDGGGAMFTVRLPAGVAAPVTRADA